VARRDWEQVNVSVRQLRQELMRIHTAIDEGRDPPLAAVAATIDDALGAPQCGG